MPNVRLKIMSMNSWNFTMKANFNIKIKNWKIITKTWPVKAKNNDTKSVKNDEKFIMKVNYL